MCWLSRMQKFQANLTLRACHFLLFRSKLETQSLHNVELADKIKLVSDWVDAVRHVKVWQGIMHVSAHRYALVQNSQTQGTPSCVRSSPPAHSAPCWSACTNQTCLNHLAQCQSSEATVRALPMQLS